MSDATKASSNKAAKAKSSKNWPMLIAAGLCLAFIIGVWANNYRVTQAAAAQAAAQQAAQAKAAAALAAKK